MEMRKPYVKNAFFLLLPFFLFLFFFAFPTVAIFFSVTLSLVCVVSRKKSQNEGFEERSTGASASVVDRARDFLENVRYFRIFIGIWNLTMLACMFM